MKLSDIEFRAMDSSWRKWGQEHFDFFRWGHPNSDFSVNRMEEHLRSHGFVVCKRLWTPLMTMVSAKTDINYGKVFEW